MNGKEMKDNDIKTKEIDVHFEGEETLSRECKEQMGDKERV